MRRDIETTDIQKLTAELKCLFNNDRSGTAENTKLKVIPVNGFDLLPGDDKIQKSLEEEGLKLPFHGQGIPFVAVTFDLEPISLDMYLAYCPPSDQNPLFRKLLRLGETATRENFSELYKQNFKRIFYKSSRIINQDLRSNYCRRVIYILNDLCTDPVLNEADPDQGDC